jgi:hypothetical protein
MLARKHLTRKFLADFSTSAMNSINLATSLPVPAPAAVAERSARGRLIAILAGISLFAAGGIWLALWIGSTRFGHPDPRQFFNVFYVLFARNEPIGLTVVVVFSLATIVWARCGMPAMRVPSLARPKLVLGVIAIATLTICTLGTHLICHDYALTADENLADFQARIFLRGKIQAEVPSNWVDAVRVIKPTFVDYFPATHSWKATYLPVYAVMRAIFQSVNLQSLLNPFLAALTLLALYGTARNVWPESKTNAVVAIGLLASSSQFLLMSMTWYAMPAHLALNTIWLWLYSRPERGAFYLAPFVGTLAIGLHQPVVHALFVLPFLVRLLWQRRWLHTAVFGVVYLAACFFWYKWKMHFMVPDPGNSIFRLANPQMVVVQPMDLLLIIAWSSLAAPLLVGLGLGRILKEKPIVQDASLSCLLTFGFYYFFYLDQAHGWGYRYFHGALACFILVAVAGFARLSILVGRERAQTFLVAGIVLSLLVQLPLRCFQVEQFVRPYARAGAVIHAMPTKMVALDPRDAWYSADLIRNDPFLENRPVVVSLLGLTPRSVAVLEKAGSVRFLTCDDLTKLGMFTTRPNDDRSNLFQLSGGK